MPTVNPANPKEVILSIINQMNNTSIVEADVTFGVPQRATGALPLRNTKVIITPKPESGYYGNKTVWYNRIHIDDLGTIRINKGTATVYSQLLSAINAKYGLYLSTNDIVDGPIPVGLTGEIEVNLTISVSSLMFYSGAKIVTPGFDPGSGANIMTPAIWDSLIKSSLISIIPTDYEISSATGISMVRTVTSFNSGKRYFEMTNNSVNGLIGFGTADADTSVMLGSDANSWALDTNVGIFSHNGATLLDLSSQVSLLGNNPVGFMLDLDAKELTLVMTGNVRVAVPGLNLPTEAIFVMCGNKSNTQTVSNIKANFGNENFLYPVPFNYYPGFGTGGVPVFPTAGTLLSENCVGVDLVGTYANGNGGTYSAIITANSPTCGGTAITTTPVPTTTLAPTTTAGTTVPPTTTAAPIITTAVTLDAANMIVDEGGFATAIYTLTPSIGENTLFDILLQNDTTVVADFSTLEFSLDSTGVYNPVPVNGQLVIPANTNQFTVRVELLADLQTEGVETFSLSLQKQASSTNISNTVALVKTFTVNDTSNALPVIPKVTENITLTGSNTIVIPAGVLEATITARGATGADAVLDTIVADTELYFRKTTEATTGNWEAVLTNDDGAGATEAIRIKATGEVESTTDGEVWTATGAILASVGFDAVSFAGRVNGFYYILTSNSVGYRSSDGITWTTLTGTGGFVGTAFNTMLFGNGVYYLGTSTNSFGTSTDGISFTMKDFGTEFGPNFSNGVFNMTFGNGVFVGIYADSNNKVIKSTDLTSFTKHDLNNTTLGNPPRALIFFAGKFIATNGVMDNGETNYQTSTNAVTWTDATFPTAIYGYRFFTMNNRLLAIHNNNINKYISSDGSVFTDISSSYPNVLTNLYFLNTKYRTQPYVNQFGWYTGDYVYVGGPELAGTVITVTPAVTGSSATVEILSTTYTYPGSSTSTTPAVVNDIVPINQPTDTVVTYVAPVDTAVSILFVRDEANGLLVPNPNNPSLAVIAEGSQAILEYDLEVPLERIVNFTFNVVFNTALAQDIGFIECSVGSGAYLQINDSDLISVPIGETKIRIRFTALTDTNLETDETLTISITKVAGTEVVLNTTPITQAVTITNVLNVSATVVMPTWVNFFKATPSVNSNTVNRSIVEINGLGTVYSRDSASSGKYYFEVSNVAATGDVFVGLSSASATMIPTSNLSRMTTGDIDYFDSAILSLTDGIFYIDGLPVITTVGATDPSTVYGFAVDLTSNILIIYKDNVEVVNEVLAFINPTDVFIIVGNWNDNLASLKLNTGEEPFVYSPPAGYSLGYGNPLTYIDDFENNNKGFADGVALATLFDVHTDGVTVVSGGYSQATNKVNVNFTNLNGQINLLPNTNNYYTDYRLTIDMSYTDGAEINPGIEWEERQFSFVTHTADPSSIPMVLMVLYRLSDGTQMVIGGSTAYALPRSALSFEGRAIPQTAVTMPFSGRHKLTYEVISVPTGKKHTFSVDGVVIASGIDTTYGPKTPISVHPVLGWSGDVEIFSYKIEDLTPDVFAIQPYVLTSTPVLMSGATLSPDELTLTYDNFSLSNAQTLQTFNKLLFGKWYWEFKVDGIAADAVVTTGIGFEDSFVITNTLSGLTTVHSFPAGTLNQNDIIGVFFDADEGILKLRINNANEIIIENISLTSRWFAVIGDIGATTTTTITANFGATPLVYAPPANYFAGLGN